MTTSFETQRGSQESQAFAVTRVVWGCVQLAVAHRRNMPVKAVLYALALRNLLQGTATYLDPSKAMLRAGAGVDLVHSGSMLCLVARHRGGRLAGADAILAATAGAVGARLAVGGAR